MSEVFNSEDPAPQNALDALVGEGKKFQTAEDLAKGKLASDNYIEQLKAELEAAKAKVTEQGTLEEILAKINERQAPATQNPTPEANQPAKPTGITEETLSEKVAALLEDRDRKAQVKKNVDEVAERLVAVHGSENAANDFVKLRAKELGLSVEDLQNIAARSPKAFFEAVRLENPSAAARPTQGDRNTQAMAHNTPGVKANTYRWYQELRKANPKLYNDPKMQLQMHNDALKNPEGFFER